MTFLSKELFVPHSYEQIENVYPAGAMPPLAYKQYVKKYDALEDVDTYRVEYESDGLRVNGLMCVPKHVQPNNHPIMLYNRGGFRHYGMLTVHSVLRNMVPFAEQGYITFAPNYRGNDGGEGEDHFAGDDVRDVLRMLELAKQHEAWDGSNSYIIGHSRGGMMTLRALAEGVQVNAAICIASLTDLTLGGEEDWRGYLKYIPEEEQANPEQVLKKRSAVHWHDYITPPLLLLHGDADDVVIAEHSQSLHKALQDSGKQSELVIYPNGNHALVRDWDDVLKRCSEWMERHAV